MTVLVTGCASFILPPDRAPPRRRPHVLGVDCFNDNYQRPFKLRNLEHALAHRDFGFVPIDLSRGDLEHLVNEVEVVFHLAAEPGVRSSWGTKVRDVRTEQM